MHTKSDAYLQFCAYVTPGDPIGLDVDGDPCLWLIKDSICALHLAICLCLLCCVQASVVALSCACPE